MTKRARLLADGRFLWPSAVASALVGVASAALSMDVQLALLGILASVLVGLLSVLLDRAAEVRAALAELSTFARSYEILMNDHDCLEIYRILTEALVALQAQQDPIFRETARTRLLQIGQELELIATGVIAFRGGTESWRTVYDRLLATGDLQKYRSAAWVRSADYWQDAPGRRSMQRNYEAINRGMLIERICILPLALWPRDQRLPSELVWSWMVQQHNLGVWVTLCREEDLKPEPDLPLDFGIYGRRAVGVHVLDELSRTHEFRLYFTPAEVDRANDRWNRLKIHTVPLQELLDKEEEDT